MMRRNQLRIALAVMGSLKFVLVALAGFTIAQSPAEPPCGNFTTTSQTAHKFGVHEIVLEGDGQVDNPFDTLATVTFTPPSGAAHAKTVWAFFDGDKTWRARVYVSEVGTWKWNSACASDAKLDGTTGTFQAADSQLHGRLLPHPKNPHQWMTENGQWFLNLNDTAYFLLCAHDGNGVSVSDEDALRYVADDIDRGITSVRCSLASSSNGFAERSSQWEDWYFVDKAHSVLRLDQLRSADHRLHLLLDRFPDVAIQLILFPLEGYARDDRFWTALSGEQRALLLRQLVARFAAYPQLFWLFTNDAHYGDKFPNSNAMVREVGKFLQQHDPWQHPRSTGHARKLPFYFGDEDWATYIHIEHAFDLSALECARYQTFNKPVFLGEDRYEQDHPDRLDPVGMRYFQRRLFWAWLLSGGSTNYGGRWWVVHPYSLTGDRQTLNTKSAYKDFVHKAQLTGLDSVKVIRDYFRDRHIELTDFEPDQSLVSDPDGNTETQAPKLMRRGRSEYLIYHPNTTSDDRDTHVDASRTARIRIDLRESSGTFAVEWIRGEDGMIQDGEKLEGGAFRDLTAPGSGADTVLRLK